MICAFKSLIGPTGADHSFLPQPFVSKASLHSQKSCGGLSLTRADLRRRQSPTNSLIFGGRSFRTHDYILSNCGGNQPASEATSPMFDLPAPLGFGEHTHGANIRKQAADSSRGCREAAHAPSSTLTHSAAAPASLEPSYPSPNGRLSPVSDTRMTATSSTRGSHLQQTARYYSTQSKKSWCARNDRFVRVVQREGGAT